MKNKIIGVLLGLAMIATGVFTLLRPTLTIQILIIIFGSIMLLRGLFLLIRYFRLKRLGTALGFFTTIDFGIGIALLVLGSLFIVNPEIARDAFTYIVAIWFIIDALRSLVSLGPIKLVSERLFLISLGVALLLLFAGIFLFINPWSLSLPIGILLGVSLLISGMNLIVKSAPSKKTHDEVATNEKHTYIEGEMVENDDEISRIH
ncbi:MAG: hypothetical protein GX219_00070 [Tissierellia bacterium]|nr:hypothetical protein [Tissierellia bacterium]